MEHKFKTIDCWVDEHRLLELLSNKQHSFNLHSNFGNERLGRYSILGADPFLTFTSFKNEIVVNKKGKKILKENTDPFTEMKLLLEKLLDILEAVLRFRHRRSSKTEKD